MLLWCQHYRELPQYMWIFANNTSHILILIILTLIIQLPKKCLFPQVWLIILSL